MRLSVTVSVRWNHHEGRRSYGSCGANDLTHTGGAYAAIDQTHTQETTDAVIAYRKGLLRFGASGARVNQDCDAATVLIHS